MHIPSRQKDQKLTSSTEDVCDILNAEDKSKGMKSNNVIFQDDMHAENINLHVAQVSRNNLMLSHSKANDSAVPLINQVSEQNYDIVTPPDAFNDVKSVGEPRVSSEVRM